MENVTLVVFTYFIISRSNRRTSVKFQGAISTNKYYNAKHTAIIERSYYASFSANERACTHVHVNIA